MKQEDRPRMLSTVWTAFVWLFILVAVFGEKAESVLLILLGLAIMTLLATYMITRGGSTGETTDQHAKLKHGDRLLLDQLLDSMSEADMDTLRRRLGGDSPVFGDDGELILLDGQNAASQSSTRGGS